MIKILFDHQAFSNQKFGGVSRYFYELIARLVKQEQIYCNTSVLFSSNHYLNSSKLVKHFRFFPTWDFKGKHFMQSLLNRLYSIYSLKVGCFDLFHPTYYDPYYLKHIENRPYVVTVYDLIHEKFKHLFSSNNITYANKIKVIKNAAKIIAISSSTKNDLVNVLGVEEKRIQVIYLGYSVSNNLDLAKKPDLPDNFLLFVGERGGYKNFKNFLGAIADIFHREPDLTLACVGGRKFSREENFLLKRLNLLQRVFHFEADDQKLAWFYKYAKAFIFPSLYEGFGIPILEAFACDCPLVCSNTSSFPEIAGNAASFFDPENVDSIVSAIESVIFNERYQKELIINGRKRLEQFNWCKTAEETHSLYLSVINRTK